METPDSITTRKSQRSVFQSITRSLATSKTFGNLLLPLTSKRGRQPSQSGGGIFPSASKAESASRHRQYCKARRRRHIHCRLRRLCQTRSVRKQNARLFRKLLQLPASN